MRARIIRKIAIDTVETTKWKDTFLHTHTVNGDSIETRFRRMGAKRGKVCFGFDGGFERALITIDFAKRRLSMQTTDWSRPQPVQSVSFYPRYDRNRSHRLRIRKTEGEGGLIKMADLEVYFDGELILAERNLNLLPEMGVRLAV